MECEAFTQVASRKSMYVKYDERAIQGSALVGQIFATRLMMRFGCSLRHEAARRVNHTFSRVALDSR